MRILSQTNDIKCYHGTIGTPTNMYDYRGERLFVGDVVCLATFGVDGKKSYIKKRIPKKPTGMYDENIYQIGDDDYIHEPDRFGSCPSCNQEVHSGMLFCPFCGQALDWSDTE